MNKVIIYYCKTKSGVESLYYITASGVTFHNFGNTSVLKSVNNNEKELIEYYKFRNENNIVTKLMEFYE